MSRSLKSRSKKSKVSSPSYKHSKHVDDKTLRRVLKKQNNDLYELMTKPLSLVEDGEEISSLMTLSITKSERNDPSQAEDIPKGEGFIRELAKKKLSSIPGNVITGAKELFNGAMAKAKDALIWFFGCIKGFFVGIYNFSFSGSIVIKLLGLLIVVLLVGLACKSLGLEFDLTSLFALAAKFKSVLMEGADFLTAMIDTVTKVFTDFMPESALKLLDPVGGITWIVTALDSVLPAFMQGYAIAWGIPALVGFMFSKVGSYIGSKTGLLVGKAMGGLLGAAKGWWTGVGVAQGAKEGANYLGPKLQTVGSRVGQFAGLGFGISKGAAAAKVASEALKAALNPPIIAGPPEFLVFVKEKAAAEGASIADKTLSLVLQEAATKTTDIGTLQAITTKVLSEDQSLLYTLFKNPLQKSDLILEYLRNSKLLPGLGTVLAGGMSHFAVGYSDPYASIRFAQFLLS
jgi:hypothetical protein